jgi:hypothetical protein
LKVLTDKLQSFRCLECKFGKLSEVAIYEMMIQATDVYSADIKGETTIFYFRITASLNNLPLSQHTKRQGV